MATFTLTYLPIVSVLENGGCMKLDDLAKSLCEKILVTFRDKSTVENAINTYVECLDVENELVKFNREAKTYAKFSIMERDIQDNLHGKLENMKEFELYPHKTRKNSDCCHIGVPWKDIPVGECEEMYKTNNPGDCDFRIDGKDNCALGCGIDEAFFK